MDSFLFSLLLVFGLALGGRDQWLAARWSDALGKSTPLLLAGMATAALSAATMAWAGAEFATLLPRPAADMLVAFALGLAGLELAWPIRSRAPQEPTRSLGAITIVLLARQIGDGARFVIFALAAWADLPLTAGLGGALGGAGAFALGWAAGGAGLGRWPLRPVRLAFAASLIVAAIFIGLNARFAAY